MMGEQHGNGMGGGKLAARFVRDVSIFDGTQMEPHMPFTKIWRLKNVGEVPWPPGTRMLFVGGDQMCEEMSVPSELGRYLGYWRLTGPHMRRKFGQRVWC